MKNIFFVPGDAKSNHVPLSEGSAKPPGVLGIELPWDWCLVRGSVLRDLQKQLREARQTAALRLRINARLQKEILRKDAR